MRIYLYPTMQEWFDYLATRPDLDEVNFWRPGGVQPFRGLDPGDLFLFRTKSPTIAIGGFAFYRHFSFASVAEAWSLFEEKNGASTFDRFSRLIAQHKGLQATPERAADLPIGCIMLADPDFWPRERWIPVPPDYPVNNPQGVSYDAASPAGQRLVAAVEAAARTSPAWEVREEVRKPVVFRQGLTRFRLGQGTFALSLLDAYESRCVVSGERTRPVLEAAHILPVEKGGAHSIDNGLVLRVDIHKLFDKGYVTVTTRGEFLVSKALKDDWRNGRMYYELHGQKIREPVRVEYRPATEFLQWHNDTLFKS
jgi:putative restriction endonuclease